MGPGTKGATVAAGVGTMILGGMLVSSGGRDLDNNGQNELLLDDDWGAYFAGSALFLAGAAIFLGGATARTPEEAPTIVAAPAPRASAPLPMVASADFASLPDRPVAPEGFALAQRVRAYSALDQCAAAWETWRSLDAIDADYALVLRRSEAMGRCRPPTP